MSDKRIDISLTIEEAERLYELCTEGDDRELADRFEYLLERANQTLPRFE